MRRGYNVLIQNWSQIKITKKSEMTAYLDNQNFC